ncbi:MAG: type I methionyl aminopeptidase [Clostridiales bacterium]|nr:type I methionyl aminopeptidase [Clostridiales bacterium]
MIVLKGASELALMREAGRIASAGLRLGGSMVRPGTTTGEINRAVHHYFAAQGCTPSFLGYGGFPAAACISVNEQVIHGIPGNRVLREGDLVSIDVGAMYQGFHGDCAATFAVGAVSQEAQRLIEVTRQAFFAGLAQVREGRRIGDIGAAIAAFVEGQGCSVVRKYVGHGIGRKLHEDPEVPNFGTAGRGPRLQAGMTLAIEPMVNSGGFEVKVLADEWTVVTADGSLSAHYENTVAVTEGEPEVLTLHNLEG